MRTTTIAVLVAPDSSKRCGDLGGVEIRRRRMQCLGGQAELLPDGAHVEHPTCWPQK